MRKKALTGFALAASLMFCAVSAQAGELLDISEVAGVADDGFGKGIAFADIDGDGFVDMYVSNKGGANHLYRNNGDGTFTDVTAESGAGLDAPGFTMGSVFGDIDNDGDSDLYLAQGGRFEIEANRLFLNNGDGTFVDITGKAGVGLKEFTYGASFADYDNDGDLDLYCANYGAGAQNVLYRNNGDNSFTDVTAQAAVGDRSWSWMGIWADVNGDGNTDLYVVNGRYPAGEPNRLYINNADGTFTEGARDAGVADGNWGLGGAFEDIDNDGDLDLFVSNYVGKNRLYLNDGSGKFTESTEKIALKQEGWGKGPTFGDIDHDGDLDLYEGDCKLANQMYLNDGAGNFSDVADAQPQLKCETVRTKGTAFADIDNDGDLDLYVVNWGAQNKLYANDQNDAGWLKVDLVGTVSNRDAFGARVQLFKGGRQVAMRESRSATGFCAQQPKTLHFGLPEGGVYELVVRFPSGKTVTLSDVRPGRTLRIEEPIN